jgi:hypothetical protein
MLRLNLLSDETKNDLKFRRLYSLVVNIDYMLLVGAMFLALVFLGSYQLLSVTYKEFSGKEAVAGSDGKKYVEKAKEINDKLRIASKVQTDFVKTSRILKELSSRIPEGISLSYIKIDLSNKSIKIAGLAKERETLLSLKEKIMESQVFNEVDSPLQNILQKEDVEFEMNIKLDLTKMPK